MLDPASFLLTEQDVPDGFSRVVDGDKSDRLDGASIKFRTFVRGDGIINCGVYAAPTTEIAETLYGQIRDDFASVGAAWEPVPDLGDEALSTSVFPVGGSIQRVTVFRAGSVASVVHYTDNEMLFQVENVVQLARRMDENGRRAEPLDSR
jgi:hypothetical protein